MTSTINLSSGLEYGNAEIGREIHDQGIIVVKARVGPNWISNEDSELVGRHQINFERKTTSHVLGLSLLEASKENFVAKYPDDFEISFQMMDGTPLEPVDTSFLLNGTFTVSKLDDTNDMAAAPR